MSDSVRPHRRQPIRLPHPGDSPGKNTGVGCHCLLHCVKVKSKSEVAQLCPTASNPMDCSLPGSSVHGIFQARVLEWGAIAVRRPGFNPWVRKIPWRKKLQPTSVFLPGKSHGQRSLEGYSPWGHKQLDMIEQLTLSLFKVLSTLIMFRWDRMLSKMRTFTPDGVLCALGHGDLGRDLAGPLSWKTPCLPLNVSAQMSGVWSWGGLLWVSVLSSEWGSMALPGATAAVGLPVFLLARFTFPGPHGDISGGLLGHYSNLPVHSVWVGRHVLLRHWFQANGQWAVDEFAVLWRQLSCPSSFSPAFLFSQHLSGTRKTQPATTKVVCSTLAWTLKPAKSHRPKVKTGEAWLLSDHCEQRRQILHFFLGSRKVAGAWLAFTLGARWP